VHDLHDVRDVLVHFDNDCTNYVSAAWHYGGHLRMTKRWRVYWTYVSGGRAGGGAMASHTSAWTVTTEFVDNVVNHRHIASLITTDPSKWHTSGSKNADLVEYDWGHGNGWEHLSILVRTNSSDGDDLVDQHTTDRKRNTWRYGYLIETNPQVANNMRTRVVHVKHR
jgi:hypothetical protein